MYNSPGRLGGSSGVLYIGPTFRLESFLQTDQIRRLWHQLWFGFGTSWAAFGTGWAGFGTSWLDFGTGLVDFGPRNSPAHPSRPISKLGEKLMQSAHTNFLDLGSILAPFWNPFWVLFWILFGAR